MKITDIGFSNGIQNKFTAESAKNNLENTSFKKILNADLNRNHHDPKKVDAKLMDVCVQMESIMVAKMLKTMRNTVEKGDFIHGGFAEEIFEDMLYDEYALNVSKNADLGIAKMLYKELDRS